jgi:pyrroline-5-carboxylate reductase
MSFPRSLTLLGAGKMGGAMLAGWLRQGLPGKAVCVIEPHPTPDLAALCKAEGVRLNPAEAVAANSDILVLAIKPQTVPEASPLLATLAGPRTTVLSILAGKTMADLAARMPQAAGIIRTIPNTPAAIGRGVTAATASPGVSAEARAIADHLLTAIGRVVWVEDEALIDAATAVSGSGPAYVFLLAECLAEAGIAAGLPPDIARILARSTVEGSGELMVSEPQTEPATLRRNVTSPNGTTAAALAVLMAEDGLQPLLTKAVAAAKRRASELAG